ncbi:glycosyltransferase [Fulvivirgaceae bacterium PWU4]|uniref:Glycosyltransferase n=1 Tax=Chryseosolibacter histidini TaxID=2782349 RepID=A0AAP2DHT6_9BACT|nr:galactosyltransferase-related protein [Chryseosolibacter histidini]MBT1695477.1 glycosyltransferase [Chryseosolibacter histidini]
MLSIIVTWKNRKELRHAMDSFEKTARFFNGELILVNFDGDEELLDEQIENHQDFYRVVKVSGQTHFHKTLAANLGASFAKNDMLFFCDCDIILNPAELQVLYDSIRNNDNAFGTLSGVTETQINSLGGKHVVNFGYELRIRTANGRILKIVDQEEDANNGYRNAPGLLMVRKEHFYAVNGYNSELIGWGWEDQDMIGRLTLGAGLTRITLGHAQHISHDDVSRTGQYPEKNRWLSRDKMFRQALSNYDEGRFEGSYTADIQRMKYSLVYAGD